MSDFEEKIDEDKIDDKKTEDVEIVDTIGAAEDAQDAEAPTFPCIPLRGLTIFPQTILHFDIGREKSITQAK